MLDKIIKRMEEKHIKKHGGIPIMWLDYAMRKPRPNMIWRLHPDIKRDEKLKVMLGEVTDYIRDNYFKED